MNIGMLWFDNSERSFEDKLKRAIKYYEDKYATRPTMCYVHIDDFPGEIDAIFVEEVEIDGVTVSPIDEELGTTIPQKYMWIGITDDKKSEIIYGASIDRDESRFKPN